MLLVPGRVTPTENIRAVAARVGAFQDENAELVVIADAETTEDTRAAIAANRLALDTDSAARQALQAGAGVLLVANKHGTLYWRQDLSEEAPDVQEALSWLGYINILEPECGCCVPAWPIE